MQIESISQTQLDLMVVIATLKNVFSVAIIPESHENYPLKGIYYKGVVKNVKALEELGLVEDVTKDRKFRKHVKAAEEETGYEYFVYSISKLGMLMFQVYADDLERQEKYKHSIN